MSEPGVKMAILIEKDMDDFLEEALDKLTIKTIDTRCPKCGYIVRREIIAKREHIEAFDLLIAAADKYLSDNGGHAMMIAELLRQINAGLAKKAN